MRYVTRVGLLTVLWVFLWGDLSVANVASGVVLASVLLVVAPVRPRDHRERRIVRPVAVVRLAVYVGVQLVVSNAFVLREILRPRTTQRAAIVVCPLVVPSDHVTTLVADLLSLSPDSIPVELTAEPPRILLHVLDASDPQRVRRAVSTLERLVIGGVGTADERECLARSLVVPEVTT